MARYTRRAEPEERVIGYRVQRGTPKSSRTSTESQHFQFIEQVKADSARKRKRYMADKRRDLASLRADNEARIRYVWGLLLEAKQGEDVAVQAADEVQRDLSEAQKDLRKARRKYNSDRRKANKGLADAVWERDYALAEAEDVRRTAKSELDSAIHRYEELRARVDAGDTSGYMTIIQHLIGQLGAVHAQQGMIPLLQEGPYVQPADNLALEAMAREQGAELTRLSQRVEAMNKENAELQEKAEAIENLLCTSMERRAAELQGIIANRDAEIERLRAQEQMAMSGIESATRHLGGKAD